VKESAIVRFWNRQSEHVQVCLATAGGALLVAGMIGAVSLCAQPWTVARGLSAVGVFYLLLGMSRISWRPPARRPCREVHWQQPQLRRFRDGGPIAREVWENN
jgi:hypothetical protein